MNMCDGIVDSCEDVDVGEVAGEILRVDRFLFQRIGVAELCKAKLWTKNMADPQVGNVRAMVDRFNQVRSRCASASLTQAALAVGGVGDHGGTDTRCAAQALQDAHCHWQRALRACMPMRGAC